MAKNKMMHLISTGIILILLCFTSEIVLGKGGYWQQQAACRVLCGGYSDVVPWKGRSGLSGRWSWWGGPPSGSPWGISSPYSHFTPDPTASEEEREKRKKQEEERRYPEVVKVPLFYVPPSPSNQPTGNYRGR